MNHVDKWYAGGDFIAHAGLQIFVKRLGHGRPILCLHAFPTSSYDFSRLAPLLANEFELIFLDYPGFGFSSKPRRFDYSLARYADVAQAVAAHFGVERLAVLAHDIGASIALELLKRGSPVVEKLMLMNGSIFSIPFRDPLMALSQKLWLNRYTGPLISVLRLFRKPLFTLMFERTFARKLSPTEIDSFWSLLCKNDGLGIYHHLMGYMPERWHRQDEWLDVLAHHPASLTLVWGQADPIATPAVAAYTLTRRPDVRYIRLAGVGHYPHWDVPEKVAQAAGEAFLM